MLTSQSSLQLQQQAWQLVEEGQGPQVQEQRKQRPQALGLVLRQQPQQQPQQPLLLQVAPPHGRQQPTREEHPQHPHQSEQRQAVA